MLEIILLQNEQETIVVMNSLKAQLENIRLHDFGNDTAKTLIKMQSILNTLNMNGHTPDSFCHCVYCTMKTGPNAHFNAFIDQINYDT